MIEQSGGLLFRKTRRFKCLYLITKYNDVAHVTLQVQYIAGYRDEYDYSKPIYYLLSVLHLHQRILYFQFVYPKQVLKYFMNKQAKKQT